MPGIKPDRTTGCKPCERKSIKKGIFAKAKLAGLKTGLALSSLPIAFSYAIAQEAAQDSFASRFLNFLKSTEILMLSVFGGAMSFALLSAFAMIRERARIANENVSLSNKLLDLRASTDLNEALINVEDQCIFVWNGPNEAPVIKGELSVFADTLAEGVDPGDFEKWISRESLGEFLINLEKLRNEAKPFDMNIVTQNDVVLDLQGRLSGSYAFIRFHELGREREEHARIRTNHETLMARYKTVENLFERLPCPVWLRDNHDRIVWINNAYATALDLEDPAQAHGKDWNLFDLEQREKIEQAKTRDEFFGGILPATVSGDRKKLEVFSYKSETGIAGIAFDKSDVDTVRKTLEVTNEGYSKILDQIATAVVIFDKSQKLIFHNDSFRQLWKMDSALLESQPNNAELLDAMREKKLLPERPDWRKWRDGQLAIYQAIEPREEWWHLTDGQTIRVIATPRNQGGSAWLFENVTERLALESNYNSLVRVQGETLDHLHEAVAVFGSNGKVRLSNPAVTKLWSIAGIEVNDDLHIVKIIKEWTDSIRNPEDLKRILGKITGLDEERTEIAGRLELKNGTTYEYSLVPLPDGQSMLTLSDITANVNFEKAMNERAEALEESDRLKSQFIQHVSYELRAPLTNISGFGEMLATPGIGELNEKQAEYLSHINTSADELRMMVDDILDLASIDAGSMELDIETVTTRDAVDEVISDFRQAFEEKGLRCALAIDGKCETMFADRYRVVQILKNLVSNAVNFSPDGGTISISANQTNGFNEIRVSDQGKGIDREQRERIFDRFETLSRQGARKGRGLGLSIVLGFVELHGGTVAIEDAVPNGACFVCRFPVEPIMEKAMDALDTNVTSAA